MPDVLKTVGRYEVLREVGRGGMAVVYLSRQTDLDRFVALKELAAFHASDPAFAQRFLRESRVAGSLSHPNIVTVHDYFEHDGTPYIAMEYVERGSLRPWVGHLTIAQIGGVLEGLLAGLAQAEQHGVVHRDLKPENLMVTADGRVKIADFGIAKATNQMQTGAFLTATGTTVGTPTYMAPEQAMAQDIGPWTDLYSVGCMAFEMFTGRVPFHDSDAPMAILLRHVNEPIPPITSVDPSLDAGVSEWVEKLLVKDPKERTQNANDAWDDFEEIDHRAARPALAPQSARLSPESRQSDTPKPLTPAPFEGAPEGQPSDEFQSFAWGAGGATEAPPGPATPPPSPAPEGPLEPGPIDVPTGPPTPPPLEPVADSGFVTFGAPGGDAPAATPPAGAPDTPAATPAPDTPAATPAGGHPGRRHATGDHRPPRAPRPTPPPARDHAAAPAEDSGFMTFGSPPVGRTARDRRAAATASRRRPTRRPRRAEQRGRRVRDVRRPRRGGGRRRGDRRPGARPARRARAGRPRHRRARAPRAPGAADRRGTRAGGARTPRARHGRAGRRAARHGHAGHGGTGEGLRHLHRAAAAPAPDGHARAADARAGGARAGARAGRLRARGAAALARRRGRRPSDRDAARARRRRRRSDGDAAVGRHGRPRRAAGAAALARRGARAAGAARAAQPRLPDRDRRRARGRRRARPAARRRGRGRRDPGAGGDRASSPSSPSSPARSRSRCRRAGRRCDSAPEIPGLALSDVATYAPGGRDGGRAVEFGMAKANDSTIMPTSSARRSRSGRARSPTGPR